MSEISERIKKIKILCDKLKCKGRTFFSAPLEVGEIEKWENSNGIRLPEQYKEWLLLSGKCDILGTLASIYLPRESEIVPDNYFVIGDLIGDGEKLCLSKDGKRIICYDHGDETNYEDFVHVLNMIIEILELECEDL